MCVDEDAIAAGLDGGRLDDDRRSIGIDCAVPDISRFRIVATTGEPLRADDPDLRSDTAAPRLALGHLYDPRIVDTANGGECSAILADSVESNDGRVLGLVRNCSTTAEEITVIAEGTAEVSYRVPFAVLPNEVAPFALDVGETGESGRLTVTAAPATDSTATRAFLVDGAPGAWTGAPDDFPGLPALAPTVQGADETWYFQSRVVPKLPNGATGAVADALDRGLANPQVMAALISPEGRVAGIQRLEVFGEADLGTPAARLPLGQLGFVGIVLPGSGFTVALWAYTEGL